MSSPRPYTPSPTDSRVSPYSNHPPPVASRSTAHSFRADLNTSTSSFSFLSPQQSVSSQNGRSTSHSPLVQEPSDRNSSPCDSHLYPSHTAGGGRYPHNNFRYSEYLNSANAFTNHASNTIPKPSIESTRYSNTQSPSSDDLFCRVSPAVERANHERIFTSRLLHQQIDDMVLHMRKLQANKDYQHHRKMVESEPLPKSAPSEVVAKLQTQLSDQIQHFFQLYTSGLKRASERSMESSVAQSTLTPPGVELATEIPSTLATLAIEQLSISSAHHTASSPATTISTAAVSAEEETSAKATDLYNIDRIDGDNAGEGLNDKHEIVQNVTMGKHDEDSDYNDEFEVGDENRGAEKLVNEDDSRSENEQVNDNYRFPSDDDYQSPNDMDSHPSNDDDAVIAALWRDAQSEGGALDTATDPDQVVAEAVDNTLERDVQKNQYKVTENLEGSEPFLQEELATEQSVKERGSRVLVVAGVDDAGAMQMQAEPTESSTRESFHTAEEDDKREVVEAVGDGNLSGAEIAEPAGTRTSHDLGRTSRSSGPKYASPGDSEIIGIFSEAQLPSNTLPEPPAPRCLGQTSSANSFRSVGDKEMAEDDDKEIIASPQAEQLAAESKFGSSYDDQDRTDEDDRASAGFSMPKKGYEEIYSESDDEDNNYHDQSIVQRDDAGNPWSEEIFEEHSMPKNPVQQIDEGARDYEDSFVSASQKYEYEDDFDS